MSIGMVRSIHGHEVMEMMVETGKAYSREGLIAAIHERFGVDARFHTCAADQMTADDLVGFLEARGKFKAVEGGLGMDASSICGH
ncbi:MAG: hypothetical protein RI897_4187 [Verrucomicrobiota bacterium]